MVVSTPVFVPGAPGGPELLIILFILIMLVTPIALIVVLVVFVAHRRSTPGDVGGDRDAKRHTEGRDAKRRIEELEREVATLRERLDEERERSDR